MPAKGHTEEQIVYALRQVEAGKKVTDVCREMGVSVQAFYSWKKRYGGDPTIIGRVIRMEATERQVVGIAPPGFTFPPTATTDIIMLACCWPQYSAQWPQ